MNTNKLDKEKQYKPWIIVLSVAIPIVVAFLFTIKINVELPIFLPPIYASTNALTAIILVIAVVMIKKGQRQTHENLMKLAIGLSVLFLVLYVLYHMTSSSTVYGDINHDGTLDAIEKQSIGSFRYLYLFILVSHILLSIGVIPFVLITYVRALAGNFERHKKIAKITFPLWLYVAVTGVIVYIMISPYYA